MAHSAAPRPATAPTHLVLLLAAVLAINYIDRGNLATAAPAIQDELHLTNTQLGVLLSAFFYTYVLGTAPLGLLAERHGAHRVLAVGVAVWSAATLLTGFAGGFASLLALRLLLGLGESSGFPASTKLIAAAVAPARLGLANGIMAFGYLAGPAIGTFVGGRLMAQAGWRVTFLAFGALSLAWLWPWSRVRLAANEPGPVARERGSGSPPGPTLAQILRERGLWATSLGHFASNYNYYFIVAWLPDYLVKVRGFSLDAMAGVAGSAYLINALAALGAGWATDRWIARGASASLVYKSARVINHAVSIGAMAGMALLPVQGSIACLFAYEVVLGLSSPSIFAVPQIMAGPLATARWVGVQNTCGNLAGILAPFVTGWLIDATGSFSGAFGLAACVNVLGVVAWACILPTVAPLAWPGTAAAVTGGIRRGAQ